MTVRADLIDAAITRALVAVQSDHDGEPCVAVGTVVKVSRTHATIEVTDDADAYVPIVHVTCVSRVEPKKKE